MRTFLPFCILLTAACGGSGGGGVTDPIRREPLVPIQPIDDPVPQGRATAATGFSDGPTAYTGNLLINTGALDDSNGGLDFATNINGSLLNGTTNYLVLGQMRGEVLGAGETAATGNLSGQVLERGQPAVLGGSFQAARIP